MSSRWIGMGITLLILAVYVVVPVNAQSQGQMPDALQQSLQSFMECQAQNVMHANTQQREWFRQLEAVRMERDTLKKEVEDLKKRKGDDEPKTETPKD